VSLIQWNTAPSVTLLVTELFENDPRHMVVDSDTPLTSAYQEVFWLCSKESAVIPYLERSQMSPEVQSSFISRFHLSGYWPYGGGRSSPREVATTRLTSHLVLHSTSAYSKPFVFKLRDQNFVYNSHLSNVFYVPARLIIFYLIVLKQSLKNALYTSSFSILLLISISQDQSCPWVLDVK